MNPLIFLGAGLLGLFFTKRSSAATLSPLPPPAPPAPSPDVPIGPVGEAQVSTPFPSGYRRLKSSEVTPELLAKASSTRSSNGFKLLAYGTVMPFTASDGKSYAVLVEQHFHEPGGPVKPWGYHHGVTLLAKA